MHWTALAHPSLPNYLGIAAGTTFGILDDRSPKAHTSDVGSAMSVFDQALAAGKTAGTYAETMPGNCHVYGFPRRSTGTPRYVVRHNPWTYFSAGRNDCSDHDRDATSFMADAAGNALPNIGFLIPNLEHDAHNGSLAAAEDDRHSGNTVLTSALTSVLTPVPRTRW